MKRERIDVLNERDLLYGMIASEKFCREIAPIIEPRLLEIDYARLVAGWVKEYYETYKTCPQKDMSKLYRAHSDEISDEALKDNILTFLSKLDKDYDSIRSFNDEYALQQSILYLKRQSLRNLVSDVDAFLTAGNVTKAENAITKYNTIEKSTGEAVSLFHNAEAIVDSYSEEKGVLFTLPGAYGAVVGRIHREDFISFLAPMKRGKSFALVDVGVNAVQQGLKVLFVSLEMSESDMIKRFWTSLTGQLTEDRDDIEYSYFVDCGGRYSVESKTISRKAVSMLDVDKKQRMFKRMFRGGDVRVLAVPAYSLSTDGLDMKIERLVQQEDYVPDVVIIDYADIMLPSDKNSEYRHQLDGIWKRLRSLAQKRKCVVFTASQSNREGISKDLSLESTSEDIRKAAHITSMVSINQSPKERQLGIVRFKQLAVREGEMEFRQAVCTQCLSIGRMVTDSHFDDEVIMPDLGNAEEDHGSRRKSR